MSVNGAVNQRVLWTPPLENVPPKKTFIGGCQGDVQLNVPKLLTSTTTSSNIFQV